MSGLEWTTPSIEEVPMDGRYRVLYRQALEEEPVAPWEKDAFDVAEAVLAAAEEGDSCCTVCIELEALIQTRRALGAAAAPLGTALDYIHRGWSPIPVPYKSKAPLDKKGWPRWLITEDTAHQWFNGEVQNIGVRLGELSGGLADVDLDCIEAIHAAPYFLPRTLCFGRASKPRSHWLYQSDLWQTEDKAAIQFKFTTGRGKDRKEQMILELRIGGGDKAAQTIFPGSVHETGELIAWDEKEPLARADGAALKQRCARAASAALVAGHFPSKGARHDAGLTLGGFLSRCGFSRPDTELFGEAVTIASGQSMEKVKDVRKAAREAWDEGNRPGGKSRGFPALAETFGDDVAKHIAGWLGYEGELEPEELPAPGARKRRKKQPAVPSEDALALDFACRHGDELRFVSFWGKWLKWTAGRWQVEKTLAAYDLARKICHGHSLGGLRARTVAAIELMARSDRRLAATTDQWDADPWLFNTPAGTVELITGNLREHRPQDYIMKIAGCGPGAEGCPMFFEFLNTIFAKDTDLINYLQRFFGYILTGLTTEHAMLFFHGAGANGKSVLVSTIAGILGEYHRVAPIDTFTATGFSRHSTDLAGLMGARLVTAHETEEGAKWAEAKLKALTGGDKITAQFMRQDYFDYVPAFKLAITGNHKPGLQSVDEAMRRRLNLIPFNVTIPKENRDPYLAEKLKAEWPGILTWMIDGCLLWQEEGRLNPPQAVITATDEYLESEDAIATWIADRCELNASYEDTTAELFKSWKAWAELMRENIGSARAFSNKLVSRPGIRRKDIGHSKARGFSGIRVIKIEEPPLRESFYRDD